MKRNKKLQIIGLVLLSSLWVGTWNAQALLIVTNHYDFEAVSGSVTEPGWTHIDTTVAYTGSSAGFDLAQSAFYGAFSRPSSTQSPTNVTVDGVYGRGAATTNIPTVVFREIVPAHSTNVSFTIWRSEPLDSFAPNFYTKVSYNGGPLVQVDAGIGSFGNYFTPITGNLALTPFTNSVPLEFYFYDKIADGSQVRLNGIEAIYTIPEPGSVALLGLAGVGIMLRRFNRRRTG